MTREIVSIGPDTPVGELAEMMESRRIKRLPVLDGGVLVGVVSRADLMAAVARVLDRGEAPPSSDDAIRERVLAELQGAAGWAPRSSVTVTVKDGVVELNGAIFEEKERAALRVAAENVPGVRAVEDRLVWVEPVTGTVIEPPPAGAAPPEPKPG
jgi:CBS domain-containing protein